MGRCEFHGHEAEIEGGKGGEVGGTYRFFLEWAELDEDEEEESRCMAVGK